VTVPLGTTLIWPVSGDDSAPFEPDVREMPTPLSFVPVPTVSPEFVRTLLGTPQPFHREDHPNVLVAMRCASGCP